MSYGRRDFVSLVLKTALAVAFLSPVAWAQKPPGGPPNPPPNPGSNPPSRNAPSSIPDPGAIQPMDQMVQFLSGRVATADGSPVPNGALVERICNNRVRQQVYPFTKGDFSMQLGTRIAPLVDASGGDSGLDERRDRRYSEGGISRRDLFTCELRATAPEFQPTVVNLAAFDPVASGLDVGVILLRRTKKVEGTTVSAAAYKAPKEARKAYEKGLDYEKNGKLAEAQRSFARAVELYPRFADAWFRLGSVLQRQDQNEAAGKAYAEAATIDTRFARPYLGLAAIAFQAEKWSEVLDLTRHLLDLDPFGHGGVGGYVLDLDPLDYAEAYFYDGYANYKLKRFEEAEKSALKAERLDLKPRVPRVHLLLAELAARKGNYAKAITETKTFLGLVPPSPDAVRVRERLAEFERLDGEAASEATPRQ